MFKKDAEYLGKTGVLGKLLFRSDKETDVMEWVSQELFFNRIGKSLSLTKGKAAVIIIYCLYLCGAILGCTQLRDGLEFDTIFPDKSYAADYLNTHLKYMAEYPHRINLVITETLDYSNLAVQKEVERDLALVESSPYVSNFTTSWLRAFLEISRDRRFCYSFCVFNMTKKDEFLVALKVFLRLPWGVKFNDDIVFNSNGTDITSSRFIITSYKITSSKLQGILLEELYDIIASCKIKYAVHETWFPFYEQTLLVPRNSVRSIAIAAATMTVVFFLFIPDILYAACVTCTILSIQVGAIGYMTFWNVNRDVVSAMCLLMSVGFSVDYSAHMINAYATSCKSCPNERLRDALGTTAVAVLQGTLSTLMGLIFLALVPAELMRLFFKILFLVILFSALHSVFVLPVFLSMVDSTGLRFRCQGLPKIQCSQQAADQDHQDEG